MKLGPSIRRLLGPYERRVSDVYRSLYVDLEALVAQMQLWKPSAKRILEVGCGEGAVTEQLSVAYPDADITAIDITPRIGRLYQGSRTQVRFIKSTVDEIVAKDAGKYDLAVLCDVLHHVPLALRAGVLEGARKALAPGGTFVFKDWQPNFAPIHWLCYASDRWLTGDRIEFMTREEMRELLSRCFGSDALVAESRVAPWWNNLATLVRP